MTRLSSTEAEGDTQVENGLVDEKEPLKNGIADKTQMVEDADRTDDVPRTEEDNKPLSSLFKKSTKRKYKTYDNGKRSRINLAPLTAGSIRIEKTIKEKTGLTRTGLVLAILCVLLTIALVVCFFLWPKTAHSKSVCNKASCLRSSAEILPKLNLSESPCSNYRNYACGNWFSSSPLPKDRSEWSMKELLEFKYRHRVHELLVTSTVSGESSSTSLLGKLKNFYDSCMDMDNINGEKDRALKKEITSFGGWVVLRTYKPVQWDQHKTLEKLYSQHNVSPFFQIDVVPNPNSSDQNIILLKPPALGLPSLDFYDKSASDPVVSAYKRYIKDVVMLFGATSGDADEFSEALFGYEKRIAGEINKIGNVTQPFYTLKTIKELKQMMHPIQLYEILFGKLPKANLNQDTYVLVANIEYFRNLPSLYSTSDNKTFNKYLIWCLVAEYVPYLSEQYINTVNIFRRELTGQSKPIPRWEFCISTLQRFAGYGLMVLYENEIAPAEKETSVSVVSQLFSESLSAVRKDIMKLRRTDAQEKMVDKFNAIGIRIGLGSYMLEQSRVDEYYINFNPIRNDFFQNVMNGVGFLQETLQRKLKNPQEDDRWLNDMISQPVAITYSAAANYVIVPSPVLQPPYFEKDYPLMSLYGGVGTEVAKAIVSSLTSSKSEQEQNHYVTAITECILGKNITKLKLPEKDLFIVTLAGLKYAYKSLQYELSLAEQSQQPAMESFENGKLFFLFYVQSICSIKTDRRLQNDVLFSTNLNDSILSNTVLSELSEFTDLYSCGQSSKYSSSLCNV